MNQEQILSILRQILLAGGGALVSKGYIDSATLTAVVGAIVVLAGSAWAIYTRRSQGLINSTAALANVHEIHTDAVTAAAAPSEKVKAP